MKGRSFAVQILFHGLISSLFLVKYLVLSLWVRLIDSGFFVVLRSPRRLLWANEMTISVTGATGFIDNHNVRVLTRSKSKAELIFPVKDFPGIIISEEAGWKGCIEGSNAVVNLAGMPMSTGWSPEVVDLTNNSPQGLWPPVLVSATAAGYYGSSETQVFSESSPSGNDYLAVVCREWEAAALKVNMDVRLARIPIGVVLGKDGGALRITDVIRPLSSPHRCLL